MATSFKELRVWQNDERYSLTDQMRRSSRSIAANISEAWRKRRYVASFVSKLSDSEQEAAETQTWTEFARRCEYCNDEVARRLDERSEEILAQLSVMIRDADRWCLPPGTR